MLHRLYSKHYVQECLTCGEVPYVYSLKKLKALLQKKEGFKFYEGYCIYKQGSKFKAKQQGSYF